MRRPGGRSHSAPEIRLPQDPQQPPHSGAAAGGGAEGVADPLGLTTIWLPANPIADIIFVHGLGGSSKRTWTWERSTNYSYFWPAWLPSEPELSRARIHTFGYRAEMWGSSNAMNILDFAKDLLFKMKYAFTQESQIGSVCFLLFLLKTFFPL